MLKTIARMEYIVEGRIYHFTCENDAPLGHVKDALMKFVQCVGQIEDQVAAAQEAKAEKANEKPVEPPKEA